MNLPSNTTPFVMGAVIGAAALGLISFTNGWVVTSGKMATEMANQNVSVQAAVCAARAEAYLKETNNTDDLTGFQAAASNARDELAKAHATTLMNDDAPASRVIDACARMLNKPAT